jgi:hypothetical protein
MLRRRRPLARAAMVGGAGYLAGKKIQQGRDQGMGEPEPAQPEPQAAAPAAPAPESTLDQLKKLGELKQQGILTDAEFEAQKQKILAAS